MEVANSTLPSWKRSSLTTSGLPGSGSTTVISRGSQPVDSTKSFGRRISTSACMSISCRSSAICASAYEENTRP